MSEYMSLGSPFMPLLPYTEIKHILGFIFNGGLDSLL